MLAKVSRLGAAIFVIALLLTFATTPVIGAPTGSLDERADATGGGGDGGSCTRSKKDTIIMLGIVVGGCVLAFLTWEIIVALLGLCLGSCVVVSKIPRWRRERADA